MYLSSSIVDRKHFEHFSFLIGGLIQKRLQFLYFARVKSQLIYKYSRVLFGTFV